MNATRVFLQYDRGLVVCGQGLDPKGPCLQDVINITTQMASLLILLQ